MAESCGVPHHLLDCQCLAETQEEKRLSDAAPQMLKALKAIAKLNSWDLGLPPDPKLPPNGEAAWKLVHAAIAKAEGK